MPSDASRNVAPPSELRPFWTFLAGTTLLGFIVTGLSVATLSAPDFVAMGPPFWSVAALLVLGELRPLITAGKGDPNGVTISTAFVFALLLHWGLAPAFSCRPPAPWLPTCPRAGRGGGRPSTSPSSR